MTFLHAAGVNPDPLVVELHGELTPALDLVPARFVGIQSVSDLQQCDFVLFPSVR